MADHNPDERSRIHDVLNHWLREQIERAVVHHAAGAGNGHQPEDHCESWYALHEALTAMHASTWTLAETLRTRQGHCLKCAGSGDGFSRSGILTDCSYCDGSGYTRNAEDRYARPAHQLREALIDTLPDLHRDADGVCHACSQPVTSADWPAHAADVILELLPLLGMVAPEPSEKP